MTTDIFDFDSCVNQRELNKVRYWGSEGYCGNLHDQGMTGKKRNVGKRGYCPKKKWTARRKKHSIKQLKRVQIGTHLKLFWPPTKTWSYGEVIHIYDDGMYKIACHDDPADQGALCYHLADYTFKITYSPDDAEHYDPELSYHEPHPEACRRSSRIEKKRKLLEISTNTRLPKRTSEEGDPDMSKNVLVKEETGTIKEEEVAYKMMKDVLVQKKITMPNNTHSDTNENSNSEIPDSENSDSGDDAELSDDGQNGSSVVVCLNRRR